MTYRENKGRHQKAYKLISEKLIPASGEADTEKLELFRVMDRFFYELYNNGLGNIESYEDYFKKFVHFSKKVNFTKEASSYMKNVETILNEYRTSLDLNDDSTEEVICYDCSGSGEDEDGEICEECGGHGEITEEVTSARERYRLDNVFNLVDKCIEDNKGASEVIDGIVEYLLLDKDIRDDLQ